MARSGAGDALAAVPRGQQARHPQGQFAQPEAAVGEPQAVPISEKNLPVVCPGKKRDGTLLCTEIPTSGSSAETRRDQAQTSSANSGSGRIRPGSLNRSVTASRCV